MATVEQIAALRLLIAEQIDAEPYTDTKLSDRIDAGGDLNTVAAEVWQEKAAKYADLVDISEGGSSRKMGDLHEQALNMVAHFRSIIPTGLAPAGGTRIRRLSR